MKNKPKHIWLVITPNVYGNKFVAFRKESAAEKSVARKPFTIDGASYIEKVRFI